MQHCSHFPCSKQCAFRHCCKWLGEYGATSCMLGMSFERVVCHMLGHKLFTDATAGCPTSTCWNQSVTLGVVRRGAIVLFLEYFAVLLRRNEYLGLKEDAYGVADPTNVLVACYATTVGKHGQHSCADLLTCMLHVANMNDCQTRCSAQMPLQNRSTCGGLLMSWLLGTAHVQCCPSLYSHCAFLGGWLNLHARIRTDLWSECSCLASSAAGCHAHTASSVTRKPCSGRKPHASAN